MVKRKRNIVTFFQNLRKESEQIVSNDREHKILHDGTFGNRNRINESKPKKAEDESIPINAGYNKTGEKSKFVKTATIHQRHHEEL